MQTSQHFSRPVQRLAGMTVCAVVFFVGCAHSQETVTFSQPQTAGISGFRALWDTPVVLSEAGAVADVDKGNFGKAPSAFWFPGTKQRPNDRPGALVFDAVHRALLVRFPGAAQKIAERMAKGQTPQKVELVLPFKATELWPEGYREPSGMSFLGEQWKNSVPRWHAVAWALRKPWQADPQSGPTFNANINGVEHWAKFGAQDDGKDRFPTRFGPTEVSQPNPEGRLDVTALLTNSAFGATPAERLRKLEYCGFLVKKEEIYDLSLFRGGYEWQTARGPQGVLINTPKLVVTFSAVSGARAKPIKPADLIFDLSKHVQMVKTAKAGGKPTAVLPSDNELKRLATRMEFSRPAYLSETDWRWQRIEELYALGGADKFPATREDYHKWIDVQLARPPRSWAGFDSTTLVQNYFTYLDAIPEPVRDHWKLYWSSWLMPDRDYDGFEHQGKTYRFAQGYVGGPQMEEYQKETGDWRGNASVYRTYARNQGTMNFNHWAVAGVLMGGGSILGSQKMMEEGRRGLEAFPLRMWSWYDGSTQESIDHYYFAESLTAQKGFADFGPDQADRMLGRSILAKSVEELASSYHPNLRRFISTSGRTGIAYVLGKQEGTMHILHTLSPQGVLTDANAPKNKTGEPSVTARNLEEFGVIGHNLTPGMVAKQTLNGEWAPEWYSHIVDNKPLPYEFTATYKQWGAFNATPLFKRNYMGHNYGMASLDVSVGNETVPFMTQWRREAKKAESLTDLGTLLIRPGFNRTELLDSIYHDTKNRNPNGSVGTQGSHLVTLQSKNKAIVLASPFPKLEYSAGRPVPEKVTSIQTTVALFNFQENPTWEVFVDNQKVDKLPFKAKYGSRITIRDGVSYVGLIPLTPNGNFERDTDIELVDEGQMTELQGGGKGREALRINAYLLKSQNAIDKNNPALDLGTMGYVVEMGDANEYGDFSSFQKHLATAKLSQNWDAATKQLNLNYQSGADTLECGYKPDYNGDWNRKTPTDQVFPVRKVNGAWPYLAAGLERDSTLSQQGTTGRLEKNGAVLTTEAGRMSYLVAEPKSGTFMALNPFSEPTALQMQFPGSWRLTADGKIGMARIIARPSESKLWIDYPTPDSQNGGNTAKSLVLSGTDKAPTVVLNGQVAQVEIVNTNGQTVFSVSLVPPVTRKISAKLPADNK